jgi:hypothetical protein
MIIRRLKFAIVGVLFFLFFSGVYQHCASAADVAFAWDAPTPATGVAGYEMGCGPGTGNYTVLRDAGTARTFTFLGIAPAVDTFCNVRAYDAGGIRGSWDGEVKVHPPVATPQNLRVTTIVALNGREISRTVKSISLPPPVIKIGFVAPLDVDGPLADLLELHRTATVP